MMRLTMLIFLDSKQAKSKLLSFLIIRAHVRSLVESYCCRKGSDDVILQNYIYLENIKNIHVNY